MKKQTYFGAEVTSFLLLNQIKYVISEPAGETDFAGAFEICNLLSDVKEGEMLTKFLVVQRTLEMKMEMI